VWQDYRRDPAQSGLVPRPVMVSNLTPAVLFRLIDRYQPTLIADEVCGFRKF
jgi:hypothetical protein